MDLFFEGYSSAYISDRALLESLGLKVDGFGRDWTDLGTVEVREADTENEYDCLTGPRPAATVKVEVSAMPAQFFRFTITRPQDFVMDDAEAPRGFRAVYEPVEVFEMSTGSGNFSAYWPMAKAIAENMLSVVPVV